MLLKEMRFPSKNTFKPGVVPAISYARLIGLKKNTEEEFN